MSTLRIERTFSCDLATNWSYWTDPKRFAAWYGPQPGSAKVLSLEPRKGGMYHVQIGGMEQQGRYSAFESPSHLRMGPADGSAWMDMRFVKDGVGTKMVLTMDGVPDEMVKMVREAWSTSFAKLDALLGAP